MEESWVYLLVQQKQFLIGWFVKIYPESIFPWLIETLGKNVPCKYPRFSSRTSATEAPSATNICETSAPTSAGEIEHYLTITPCYHLTILATAGPESQAVMSLQFPLSSLSSKLAFVIAEEPCPMHTCTTRNTNPNANMHFISKFISAELRGLVHHCHHHLWLVWDRWVSGLQPLIGFVLPPAARWSPCARICSQILWGAFRYFEAIANSRIFLEVPIAPPSGPGGIQSPANLLECNHVDFHKLGFTL